MKQEGGPVRRVHRAVRAFFREHAALADAGRALVGISGGPDSVCLLDAVAALQDETGVEARAAHLDHGLRGEESRADAAYVAGLCERLGVGLDIECVDVAALAKESRRSLEEAGRLARYDFFARVVHRRGAGAVLVAHTADDQAETVLLHLTRGAGLAGLGGMRPLTSWGSPEGTVRVGRPLLGLTRADTEAYCAARELRPRLDSSNDSLDFARNRIRHDVMPVLREINAGAGENAARSAELAAQAVDLSGKPGPRVAGGERLDPRRRRRAAAGRARDTAPRAAGLRPPRGSAGARPRSAGDRFAASRRLGRR